TKNRIEFYQPNSPHFAKQLNRKLEKNDILITNKAELYNNIRKFFPSSGILTAGILPPEIFDTEIYNKYAFGDQDSCLRANGEKRSHFEFIKKNTHLFRLVVFEITQQEGKSPHTRGRCWALSDNWDDPNWLTLFNFHTWGNYFIDVQPYRLAFVKVFQEMYNKEFILEYWWELIHLPIYLNKEKNWLLYTKYTKIGETLDPDKLTILDLEVTCLCENRVELGSMKIDNNQMYCQYCMEKL
ncbi:MAG: hypothetical protein NZ870_05265, partial [bacterium]|nr:hypothetical protein [bacterium]